MIDKILPGEIRKNEEVFERSKQKSRENLVAAQRGDVGRLEEKIKALVWKDHRRRDTEQAREEQRVSNNQRDMQHAHFLEGRLKAEMSVKPSALWQKRSGYSTTSSSLRGQQMLDGARGNTDRTNAVFADSLVDKHDYSGSLSGTVRRETGGQVSLSRALIQCISLCSKRWPRRHGIKGKPCGQCSSRERVCLYFWGSLGPERQAAWHCI